jgi:DNA-binding transcriptional ArsR family regulator
MVFINYNIGNKNYKGDNMLQVLFGSLDKERVLQFILAKKTGYASQIALFYNTKPSQITKQLESLENGGLLSSTQIGRTRLYSFNPRYFFLEELNKLLIKARDAYDPKLKKKLLLERTRPRRKGKVYTLKNKIEAINE